MCLFLATYLYFQELVLCHIKSQMFAKNSGSHIKISELLLGQTLNPLSTVHIAVLWGCGEQTDIRTHVVCERHNPELD